MATNLISFNRVHVTRTTPETAPHVPNFNSMPSATWLVLSSFVVTMLKIDFWHRAATAGSDVVQSGRPIFDDFFQHLWPYIGNNMANVVFQMVKRLWLIRIDQ
ncbi:hypothetical protein TNCV_934341 [Trichonephila clavipes]|nr:hypothetical protein TNCV_934341 [Trichonephila clavipes]